MRFCLSLSYSKTLILLFCLLLELVVLFFSPFLAQIMSSPTFFSHFSCCFCSHLSPLFTTCSSSFPHFSTFNTMPTPCSVIKELLMYCPYFWPFSVIYSSPLIFLPPSTQLSFPQLNLFLPVSLLFLTQYNSDKVPLINRYHMNTKTLICC